MFFSKKNLFLLLAVFLGVEAQGLCPEGAATHDPVTIVLILSEDAEGLYCKQNATDDPIYMSFESAMRSKQLIIANPTILHWLAQRTIEGRDGAVSWLQQLDGGYSAYLATSDDYVVLLPKGVGLSLEHFGIEQGALQVPLLTAAAMEHRFAKERYAAQPISIEHFANLFSTKSMQAHCPKIFSIVGHGLDSVDDRQFGWGKPRIAQLEIFQVVQLLQELNSVNTKAAYLCSCYQAGKNLLKLQNILSGRCNDERCGIIEPLTYPLMVQGTTDMPTSLIVGHYCSFPALSAAFSPWIQNNYADQELFCSKMAQLFDQVPADDRFFNYPVLRMPGKTSTFKAVPLTSTIVVASAEKEPKLIELVDGVDAVQCYTADLHNVIFHASSGKMPGLVSRVTGAAHHFIGVLSTDAQGDVLTILTMCCLNGMATDDGDLCAGLADKAWFIHELKSAGETIARGVVVRKGCLKKGVIVLEILYQDDKGQFRRISRTVRTAERHDIVSDQINQTAYCSMVQRIYWETLPGADALAEATDGAETRADHDALLQQFGACSKCSLSVPDEQALIREDFAALSSGKLNKDIYVTYATYMSNPAICNAIVDECIKGNIFEAADVTDLLTHLIDHEYQWLVFEPIKKLVTQEDQHLLLCAINAFGHLIDKSLHCYATKSYDDIIVCARSVFALGVSLQKQKPLLAALQHVLCKLMVMLVQKNLADIAVEKVLALLTAPELGLQGFGLVLIEAMRGVGYTNQRIEAKRSLISAIAMRLEAAVAEGNIVAAYFSQQAMIKTYTHCLAA